MKKDIKGQLWIGIVCIILGFVITLQLKSVLHNYGGTEQIQRSDSLLSELNNQKDINADLLEQILQMREEIGSYRNKASESSDYAEVLSEQLSKAELLSGMLDVEGTGVILTLNDSKEKSDQNPENYIIHDDDLRKVVNELFASGAEAVSINGDRLISTSSIRCVGPVILINGNKYTPPFEIRAIGNPETLKAAVNLRGGVVDILRSLWKIEVDVKEYETVLIPKYKGVINFKYAKSTGVE
jgi:uncharacterized protein YlxW (UPF0749 family)